MGRRAGSVGSNAGARPLGPLGELPTEQAFGTKTAALGGGLAPQRAALVLSIVAGFQVMRQMIGLSALSEADPAALTKLLAPLFQRLIDGDRSDQETL